MGQLTEGFLQPQTQEELGKQQGMKHSSAQAVRAVQRAVHLPAARSWELGTALPARGLRQAPTPALPHPLCHLLRASPSVPCQPLPCRAQRAGKGEARHVPPAGHPCLHLHALRAIPASSRSSSWPECVGNGVGGQREAAGPRQADPTLAPLPGVSELPCRVSLLCCSCS